VTFPFLPLALGHFAAKLPCTTRFFAFTVGNIAGTMGSEKCEGVSKLLISPQTGCRFRILISREENIDPGIP
jgi:hypothetical protein